MIPTPTLQTVAQALQNSAAVDFVRASVKAGYREFFPHAIEQAYGMVDAALDKLAQSQTPARDPSKLSAVAVGLVEHTFKKQDDAFWFNQIYHHYKTRIKPETDARQLHPLIAGTRVLDYGCGSGYLAARLARSGYQVFTTDVLDYRYAEAKPLPFVQMTSPTDRPYPEDSMDTALVQAVLHHVNPDHLAHVLQHLALMARRVVIKEDTYDLPTDLPGLPETLAGQPLLQEFVRMPPAAQYEALVLIDFYANAIAQGIPEMNMPFEFKSVSHWQRILPANRLQVIRTIPVGFELGRMHKSCHIWFVCERIE